MAVAYILDFDGGTSTDYDWVMERMALGGRLPAGALFHAAGATDSGWRVCDVWESAAAFEQFAGSRIGPLTAERGMAEPRIRSFETHLVRRGAPGNAGFLQVVTVPGLDAAGAASLDIAVLGPERAAPEGCVFHVDGALDDGWCVVECWSSKQVRDRFIEASVAPAMQTSFREAPSFEEFEVHNALTEPARHPA